jgi:hypothetical protein
LFVCLSVCLFVCSTGKKYETSSIEAMTKQKLKEQKIRNAQRQMDAAEESFFDL